MDRQVIVEITYTIFILMFYNKNRADEKLNSCRLYFFLQSVMCAVCTNVPATQADSDGFMNIPDAVEENLSFN